VVSLLSGYSIEIVNEADAHRTVLVVAGADWPSRLSRFREDHGHSAQQRLMLLTQSGDGFLTLAPEAGFRVIVDWDDRSSFEPAFYTAATGGSFCSTSLLAGPGSEATRSLPENLTSRLGVNPSPETHVYEKKPAARSCSNSLGER
jgi:hypothetical protein